jgi:peptide/nickel transport system substrate-binding protein
MKSRFVEPHINRRDLLKSGAAAVAGAVVPTAVHWQAAAAATSGTLVVAAPATPQSLDSNFDVSLGTFEAVAALYDNLLEFAKIPDPKVPGAFREDIADHPDKPAGLAVQGKLAESFELDPNGNHPISASSGGQGQLGQ